MSAERAEAATNSACAMVTIRSTFSMSTSSTAYRRAYSAMHIRSRPTPSGSPRVACRRMARLLRWSASRKSPRTWATTALFQDAATMARGDPSRSASSRSCVANCVIRSRSPRSM